MQTLHKGGVYKNQAFRFFVPLHPAGKSAVMAWEHSGKMLRDENTRATCLHHEHLEPVHQHPATSVTSETVAFCCNLRCTTQCSRLAQGAHTQQGTDV